jgi:hypothetical protein
MFIVPAAFSKPFIGYLKKVARSYLFCFPLQVFLLIISFAPVRW